MPFLIRATAFRTPLCHGLTSECAPQTFNDFFQIIKILIAWEQSSQTIEQSKDTSYCFPQQSLVEESKEGRRKNRALLPDEKQWGEKQQLLKRKKVRSEFCPIEIWQNSWERDTLWPCKKQNTVLAFCARSICNIRYPFHFSASSAQASS